MAELELTDLSQKMPAAPSAVGALKDAELPSESAIEDKNKNGGAVASSNERVADVADDGARTKKFADDGSLTEEFVEKLYAKSALKGSLQIFSEIAFPIFDFLSDLLILLTLFENCASEVYQSSGQDQSYIILAGLLTIATLVGLGHLIFVLHSLYKYDKFKRTTTFFKRIALFSIETDWYHENHFSWTWRQLAKLCQVTLEDGLSLYVTYTILQNVGAESENELSYAVYQLGFVASLVGISKYLGTSIILICRRHRIQVDDGVTSSSGREKVFDLCQSCCVFTAFFLIGLFLYNSVFTVGENTLLYMKGVQHIQVASIVYNFSLNITLPLSLPFNTNALWVRHFSSDFMLAGHRLKVMSEIGLEKSSALVEPLMGDYPYPVYFLSIVDADFDASSVSDSLDYEASTKIHVAQLWIAEIIPEFGKECGRGAHYCCPPGAGCANVPWLLGSSGPRNPGGWNGTWEVQGVHVEDSVFSATLAGIYDYNRSLDTLYEDVQECQRLCTTNFESLNPDSCQEVCVTSSLEVYGWDCAKRINFPSPDPQLALQQAVNKTQVLARALDDMRWSVELQQVSFASCSHFDNVIWGDL